jgi:hypothetical protein
MSYTLQAFIGEESDARSAAPSGAAVIALPQSKALVPLTRSVRKAHDISFLPLTDDGADDVPEAAREFAARAKKIAYVEAEFFGGAGTQAAAVWEEGRLVFGPVVADDAINQALRVLGVAKKEHFDEFEALSLGRHRDTDEWK